MLDLLNLKPEAFGFDISDLSLKVVKLKKGGKVKSFNSLKLASFGETEIAPGVIIDGEIKKEDELVKTIKIAISKVKGGKLKTRYAVVSLPEEKAFLQVIQMPVMKEEELKKAVYFEAENYVPLPIDQVYLDSQVVKPVANHLDHLDVLIAALPMTTVDSYISALKKAGIQPIALEIESLAIARSLVKNNLSPVPILLIDLGATGSSFIIFSGHSLRFTSSIPISSNKLTEAIAQDLRVDLKEAEKLKIKYTFEGIKKIISDDETSGKGFSNKRIFTAMAPVLVNLVEQIKKYLSYYQTHASHEHLPSENRGVQKIVLCGGGANLRGICDFLSAELRLPVELGNPWVNILPEPLREVPELSYGESLKYTTSLGLALRGINIKNFSGNNYD